MFARKRFKIEAESFTSTSTTHFMKFDQFAVDGSNSKGVLPCLCGVDQDAWQLRSC